MEWGLIATAIASGVAAAALTVFGTAWFEDRRRWHADRRTVYAKFVRACGTAYRVAWTADRLGARGLTEAQKRWAAETADAALEWEQGASEIRLLGSSDVIEASKRLANATWSLQPLLIPASNPAEEKPKTDRLVEEWEAARAAFEMAARNELGIDRPRWPFR